ncbi:MAG: cobalt ECF transporter T component CbiQ [Leptolinea sp.]
MLELYQRCDSPIHELDARVKIIFTLAFILAISLTPSGAWPAFVLFFSVVVSINLLSRVSIGFVQKRAALAIPFVLSAIPLIFLGPTPIISFPISDMLIIPISPSGFVRFISIAIKAWISVQMAVLLTASTPFMELLAGFRQLRVPAVFISIIELMWRYLFLMIEEVSRLIRARNSRSSKIIGNQNTGGSIMWRATVTGGMAGSLFLRSIERSDRVYAAMLSRGYTGEPHKIISGRFDKREWVITLTALFVLFCLFLTGLFYGA